MLASPLVVTILLLLTAGHLGLSGPSNAQEFQVALEKLREGKQLPDLDSPQKQEPGWEYSSQTKDFEEAIRKVKAVFWLKLC